jgi:hypothetical protein
MKLLLSPNLRACRDAAGLAASVLILGATGCSSASSGGYTPTPDSGAGTTHDSGAVADAGAPQESGGGGQETSTSALSLPLFVSDQFIPSGFMNDPTGITLSSGANGSAQCPSRAPGAGGDCFVVSWASTGAGWAGVYWQYPSNNWGTEPGVAIAAGAKQISFYARGDVGGEAVQFKAGGINDPVSSSVGTYGDSFSVSSPVQTLTTSWTQYTISLEGATYGSGVLGGFCWVASQTDAGNGSIKFYVDDLKWQ